MKKAFLAVAATTAVAGLTATPAFAVEVTGNAGFVTNYIWRGADQSNGKAAAQGGLDLTAGQRHARCSRLRSPHCQLLQMLWPVQ